jgi:hypothetical protein
MAGPRGVWAGIAREILGVELENVRVNCGPSAPDSGPAVSSRGVTIVTKLVEQACIAIQKQRFRDPLPITVRKTTRPQQNPAWEERFPPPEGAAADLGGFRLIAMDTCKYQPDARSTSGMITEGLMAWVLNETAAAKAAGKPVIGMAHHNLTEHVGFEQSMFRDYMLDDYREAREILADAGMHFFISGHIHVEEIGEAVSDGGETIFDICGSALTTFPYTFREITFGAGEGKITADVRTFPADEALPVTAAGVTYPQPYAKTGFLVTYGVARGELAGLPAYVAENISNMLRGQLENIRRAGGINAFLKESGTDIERSLHDALGGGLAIGDWNIFSEKNIAGLAEDLLVQVDALYIDDPARLDALLESVFAKLFAHRISKLPCTQFIDTLGFGGRAKPGTLEDFAKSALAYLYGDPGDFTKDAFFMDVVGQVQSGALLDELLNLIVEILVEDVIGGELLPALRFNAKSVFANQLSKDTVGCLLNVVLDVLRGTVSRSRAAGLLHCLGFKGLAFTAKPIVGLALPADLVASLNNALNQIITEFLLVRKPTGGHALLVYDGPREVEIGLNRDYRAPFDISVERGGDGTSAVITWYTKRSVTASDVLVSDSMDEGGLKQPLAAGLTVMDRAEDGTRTINAIDLGVAVILGEELKATKHTVTIDGLASGKDYFACVGDAARGWLSPPIFLGEEAAPGFWQQLAAFLQRAFAVFMSLLRGLL